MLDPTREESLPLSFGGGPHFYLGAQLARLEAQIAFPVILNRFPGLRRAGEPVRRNQLVRRCYQTLPVTLGSLSRDAVVGTCPPGGVLAIQSAGASR